MDRSGSRRDGARMDHTGHGRFGRPAPWAQIVDATIVAAPRQRMTDAGKEIVKGGGIPPDWQANPRKPAQKDRDARWTLKRGRRKTRPDGSAMGAIATPVFGGKSHINADRRHGFVRTWIVTDAARIVFASGTLVLQARPRETHERQPVADQELRTVVRESVLRLNDRDPEHKHRVMGRAGALPAIRLRRCRVRIGTENLEIHRRNPGFELIAQMAQTLEPFINVEKSGLLNHPSPLTS